MRMRMTSDPLYKEFIANGGGLSSIFLDEGHFRTKLEKFYGGRASITAPSWMRRASS
jgi:hypothetical protein